MSLSRSKRRDRIGRDIRRYWLSSIAGVVTLSTLSASAWLYRTSTAHQRRADIHAREAATHEANRGMIPSVESRTRARKAEFHSQMNAKWEYAAYHPWLAVEPDPAEPE